MDKLAKMREYYANRREQMLKEKQKYYLANKETLRLKKKAYYDSNKSKVIAKNLSYINTRSKVDVEYRLSRRLRSRLNLAIRNEYKGGLAVKELGCSISDFKEYLESKFQEGMTWDNYGLKGWHIDHINPLSNFDLLDDSQIKLACHYTNLQPLWAKDNLRKSNAL